MSAYSAEFGRISSKTRKMDSYFARFREKITKKCRIRERICTFGRICMWTGLFNAVLLDYPCENQF